MTVEIIYVNPGSPGYHPVFHMARLAAELFEAELVVLRRRSLTLIEEASGLMPRTRNGLTGLLICPLPHDLASLLFVSNWRKRYGRVVAWVFDSFWHNHVPRF